MAMGAVTVPPEARRKRIKCFTIPSESYLWPRSLRPVRCERRIKALFIRARPQKFTFHVASRILRQLIEETFH